MTRAHPNKGMDPADPYFENTEPLIRLDPTDGNVIQSSPLITIREYTIISLRTSL